MGETWKVEQMLATTWLGPTSDDDAAANMEPRKRSKKKDKADSDLTAALEGGVEEEIRKAARSTARATPQMNADVQELLRLLGCPVVLAPSQCARATAKEMSLRKQRAPVC